MRYRMTKSEKETLAQHCLAIVSDYTNKGFRLTVRQIHYLLISRFPKIYSVLPEPYGRCQRTVAELRQNGLLNWDAIEDRTRLLNAPAHWASAVDMLESCADQFRIDMWANQKYRPEIWTEKQAVIGIVYDLQDEYHLTLYSCRGFNSLSGVHKTRQRFEHYLENGQIPVVLYLGDCDPSGQIMDGGENGIEAQLPAGVIFERLAITAEQARERNLPALSAKPTDTRTSGYVERNGSGECWEVDALAPDEIQAMIVTRVKDFIDSDPWDNDQAYQQKQQSILAKIAKQAKCRAESL